VVWYNVNTKVSGNTKTTILTVNSTLMNMRKIFLTLLLTVSFSSIFSQSKQLTLNKLKTFMHQYQINLRTHKTGNNPIIFYNDVEKILDIDGTQIPLFDVKTTYYVNETGNHCVSFDCKNEDCISKPEGNVQTGFAIPFLTKKNCYDFISIINQLKREKP
jgi:hypothetical protein